MYIVFTVRWQSRDCPPAVLSVCPQSALLSHGGSVQSMWYNRSVGVCAVVSEPQEPRRRALPRQAQTGCTTSTALWWIGVHISCIFLPLLVCFIMLILVQALTLFIFLISLNWITNFMLFGTDSRILTNLESFLSVCITVQVSLLFGFHL